MNCSDFFNCFWNNYYISKQGIMFVERMTIEVELKEIKLMLSELNKKVDALLEEKETASLMALEEKSLKEFLEKEPDIYTVKGN